MTIFTRDGLVHTHSDTCSHSLTSDQPSETHCTCIWAVDVYMKPELCPNHGTESCQAFNTKIHCVRHLMRLYDVYTGLPLY